MSGRWRGDPPELGEGGWEVERLVPGGEGFLRAPDGRATFVPGAFPGDVVRPIAGRSAARMVRVERFELLRSGPDRVAPPCPVADRCGGCDWIGLRREAQLHWKRELVRDALSRIGRLRDLDVSEARTAGGPLGYRTQLRLGVAPRGLGLRERGSHRLVVLQECAVAAPALNAALGSVRELIGDRAPRGLDQVEIRVADRGEPIVTLVPPRGRPRKGLTPIVERWRPRVAARVAGAAADDSMDQSWALSDGTEYQVPADAFVQVNPAVNAILVDALVAGATSRGARRFLDLFCGAGNFALPLGREGLTGVGIESNRSAIAVASKAAAQQGLAVRFRAASVVEALAEPSRLQAVDLVVLDPPRAGASDEVAGIVALEPQWIAYVSCDPATLARDLRTLVDGGYRITEVTPFDMFPHTHHVETLVWLQRGAFDQSGDAAGVELSEGDAGSS